jgi:biopolymer transport protein ExbD
MRRRNAYLQNLKPEMAEFDLDLAPLLSIMVKLIPILLISSAFVQIAVIESDLPEPIARSIAANRGQKDAPELNVSVSRESGIAIEHIHQGKKHHFQIPMKGGTLNYEEWHKTLVNIKTKSPELFTLKLSFDGSLPYQDLVRMIDYARKSQKSTVTFTFQDPETKREKVTQLMFPDVVFTDI